MSESAAQLEPAASELDRPKRILLVDDDAIQIDCLSHRLKQQGFEILTCYRGQDALAIATEQHPDLILLDLRLPDINGFEVCAQLSDAAKTCDIPIIIVSAVEGPDVVRNTRASGGFYFVRKPYDPNVLLTLVEHTLGGGL